MTQTFSYSLWAWLRLTFLNGILPNSSRQWPNLSLQSYRCKVWHSESLCLSHWFSKWQAPRHCKQIPCSQPTIFCLFVRSCVNGEYKFSVIFKQSYLPKSNSHCPKQVFTSSMLKVYCWWVFVICPTVFGENTRIGCVLRVDEAAVRSSNTHCPVKCC